MSKEQVADSVKEEFSKLSLDGKTAFLVEAIFSTAGSAIKEIAGRLNGLVSLVTDPFEASDDSGSGDPAEAEAEESTEGEAGASSSGGKTQSRSKKK